MNDRAGAVLALNVEDLDLPRNGTRSRVGDGRHADHPGTDTPEPEPAGSVAVSAQRAAAATSS